jgi:hypothetical protein
MVMVERNTTRRNRPGMVAIDELDVHRQLVGALPVVNHILGRLRVDELLAAHLPTDARPPWHQRG